MLIDLWGQDFCTPIPPGADSGSGKISEHGKAKFCLNPERLAIPSPEIFHLFFALNLLND